MKRILIALFIMIIHSNFLASAQDNARIHRVPRPVTAARQPSHSAPTAPIIFETIFPKTPPPLHLTMYPPPPAPATRLKSPFECNSSHPGARCLWIHDNTHAPQQFETAAAITILLQQITGQELLQYQEVSITSMKMPCVQYVIFKTCRNKKTEIAASKFSVSYDSTHPEITPTASIFDIFKNSEEKSYETNGFCKKTTSQFSSIIARSTHLIEKQKLLLASILHVQRSGTFVCKKHEDGIRIAIELYDVF